MVLLVALVLILGIILMLVLLERNTGGRNGGVGCVSGAVILALVALAASQYEPADATRLAGEFRQLLLVGLIVVAVIGVGYLAFASAVLWAEDGPFRRGAREQRARYQAGLDAQWAAGVVPSTLDPREISKKREVRAAYWVDALSLLDDEAYDAWIANNRDEIQSALTPDDWKTVRTRRAARRQNP